MTEAQTSEAGSSRNLDEDHEVGHAATHVMTLSIDSPDTIHGGTGVRKSQSYILPVATESTTKTGAQSSAVTHTTLSAGRSRPLRGLSEEDDFEGLLITDSMLEEKRPFSEGPSDEESQEQVFDDNEADAEARGGLMGAIKRSVRRMTGDRGEDAAMRRPLVSRGAAATGPLLDSSSSSRPTSSLLKKEAKVLKAKSGSRDEVRLSAPRATYGGVDQRSSQQRRSKQVLQRSDGMSSMLGSSMVSKDPSILRVRKSSNAIANFRLFQKYDSDWQRRRSQYLMLITCLLCVTLILSVFVLVPRDINLSEAFFIKSNDVFLWHFSVKEQRKSKGHMADDNSANNGNLHLRENALANAKNVIDDDDNYEAIGGSKRRSRLLKDAFDNVVDNGTRNLTSIGVKGAFDIRIHNENFVPITINSYSLTFYFDCVASDCPHPSLGYGIEMGSLSDAVEDEEVGKKTRTVWTLSAKHIILESDTSLLPLLADDLDYSCANLGYYIVNFDGELEVSYAMRLSDTVDIKLGVLRVFCNGTVEQVI